MVESILSASAIGTSYSNSGRTIPVRGPLMATVAMSPDIRTLALRPWYAAIKPSRMLTLRTVDCLQSSLATKNFRSISIGPWCSCSLGRSNFSRTDILVLIEIFTSAVVCLADARTCAVFASVFRHAQLAEGYYSRDFISRVGLPNSSRYQALISVWAETFLGRASSPI